MVEIDADVIAVAKEHFQAVHNGVFDNPKLRVLVDDGMKFVRETQERFDLIALDLNDPVGPAAALYSLEFFQQLRAALAPGGALTLHLGSPVAQPQRVAELAQRLNGVFRIVRVVHHVHPAVRLALVDGGVLRQARSEGLHRRRDRPAHRGSGSCRSCATTTARPTRACSRCRTSSGTW